MQKHIAWHLMLIVLIALLFSGCDVLSENPLSDPTTAKACSELYGHWTAGDGDKILCHVIVEPAGVPSSVGMMKVTLTNSEMQNLYGLNEPSLFHCFCTELESGKYINVLSIPPRSQWLGHRCLILKLHNLNEIFVVFGLSSDLVSKAAANETLKIQKSSSHIVLSDTSDELRQLLNSKDGQELFGQGMVLQRQGTAEEFLEARRQRLLETQNRLTRQQEEITRQQQERIKKENEARIAWEAIEAAKWREWVLPGYKYRVRAQFTSLSPNGKCKLLTRNFTAIIVDIGQLNKADQDYVRQIAQPSGK